MTVQASRAPRGFYQQGYLAITDFLFYRSLLSQPLLRTLRYLLLLSAHVSIVQTLIYAWTYGPQWERFAAWAQDNFPRLQVKEETLQVDAPQPLVRTYEGTPRLTFVFDTTGSYRPSQATEGTTVLLTGPALIVEHQGQTQTFPWKDFGPFVLDQEGLQQLATAVKWGYFPVAYSFLLLFNLAAKSIQAVLLSLFAFSGALRFGVRLPFRHNFTIALYSLTPAIVVDLAVASTGVQLSFFTLIYLSTAAIYTYLAAQRCVAEP